MAIGDFDTSLRVSASFRNIKAGSGDTIVQDGSQVVTSTYARAPARQENTRELNTAEKRNLFAQNRPRSTVGTAGFMAPEVLRSRGSTPYGFKADSEFCFYFCIFRRIDLLIDFEVYSFGMLLYEMITLKLPYEQLDTADIIDAVLEGHTIESMILRDEFKAYAGLVDLYQHCTNLSPDERPSLDDVIHRLSQIVSGQSPSHIRVERKPSLVEQLNKYNSGVPPIFDGLDEDEKNLLKSSKVKFRGPQTQRGPRFPPVATGDNKDIIFRDHIGDMDDLGGPDLNPRNSLQRSASRMLTEKKKPTSRDKKSEKKIKKLGKKKKKHEELDFDFEGASESLIDPTGKLVPVVKLPKQNPVPKSQLLSEDLI